MACNCKDPVKLTKDRDAIRRQSDGSIKITINGVSYKVPEFNNDAGESFDFCQAAQGSSDCLISDTGGNTLTLGSDGLLYVPSQDIPDYNPCDDAASISQCIVSNDSNNILGIGSDGKLFVPETEIPDVPNGITINSISSGSAMVDLNNGVGAIYGPIVTTTVPQDFDGRPASGLVTFFQLGNNQNLVGNGELIYRLEFSVDGGTTWIVLKTQNVVRSGQPTGSLDISNVRIESDVSIAVLNSVGAGQVRVRPAVEVVSVFEAGSFIDIEAGLSYIAGPEYNGVVT